MVGHRADRNGLVAAQAPGEGVQEAASRRAPLLRLRPARQKDRASDDTTTCHVCFRRCDWLL